MNIAARPASLAFSVNHSDGGPTLEWHGEVGVDAQQVLDGITNLDDAEVFEFLNAVVGEEPMTWKEIIKAAKEEGYTEGQIRIRRGRSRLVKIIGHEGNRSTRWGYLRHVTGHLPRELLDTPLTATSSVSKAPCTESGSDPGSHPHTLVNGKWAQEAASGGSAVQEGDGPDREAMLDAAPLACEVCKSEENCTRWYEPYWTIRCENHNPLTYRGSL
jgi:hypothetical protein